ncbi:F-box protein-like protein [Tanacetum coccineum]
MCVFEPIGAISWNRLRTLCNSQIKLDEGVIENILSGSPLLEAFELQYCYGYKRLDITSKSLENLVFSGYVDVEGDSDVIEINAPNILTLKVEGGIFLRKLLLLKVSSLVKFDLDYTNGWLDDTKPQHEEMEMLKGLILSLHHALSWLKDEGFTIPSNNICPDITSRLSFDSEDKS